MKRIYWLVAIVLILCLASCTIVMNRKFGDRRGFRPIDDCPWEVGVPVYTALANNINKEIWDSQNFMIYIPFSWVGEKVDSWWKDFRVAVESRYIRIDSVITRFLPLDSIVVRRPPQLPYMEDSTEFATWHFQNYRNQVTYPCLVFDTLTIPAEIDSVRSEFIVRVGPISKVFEFILYRKEGKKLKIHTM